MSSLNTPTKNTSQNRKTSLNKQYVLKPSSSCNQRISSENTPSLKSDSTFGLNNESYSLSNITSSPMSQPPRLGSRPLSRVTSRVSSRGNASFYQQTTSNSNSMAPISTPQKTSLSRTTSRSSSRLSMSSMGTSSVTSSRIPSGSMYMESPLSVSTLEPKVQKKSRIQVTVRPRPLDFSENNIQNGINVTPWQLNLENSQIENPDLGCFKYDHVFSTEDDNQKVFDIVARPVIIQCLNGYNGTIFAYGMTGSGKTYSMRGVVQQSVSMLFKQFKEDVNDDIMDSSSDIMDQDNSWMNGNVFNDETIVDGIVETQNKIKYMTCSILEIYNEKLNDLLLEDIKDTNPGAFGNKTSRSSINDLRIVEDSKFGIKVKGLKEVKVTSIEQLLTLIDRGERLRSIDTTEYNYRSSRSHFIIMLKITLEREYGNETVSSLNFCDLAGSERAAAHSDRRKEGGYINKSLLALGTVITKLSETNAISSNSHIPYRDSKLTRILQPSLSGGSMVSILCTIQMGSNVIGETTNTLRFGLRAKNVTLNVKQNSGEIDINKLIHENETLKMELTEIRSLLQLGAVNNNNNISGNLTDFGKGERDIDTDIGNKEDVYYELIAENNILNEQVEHLKRLQLEDNIIRSQQCNDDVSSLSNLLGGLILDTNTRKKTEELLIRIERGLHEYNNQLNEIESYVGHLENRIRVFEIELARKKQNGSSGALNTVANLHNSVNRNTKSYNNEMVEELHEEIEELKQRMIRKDAMIRALQRADRV